jgi:hypothetical protein
MSAEAPQQPQFSIRQKSYIEVFPDIALGNTIPSYDMRPQLQAAQYHLVLRVDIQDSMGESHIFYQKSIVDRYDQIGLECFSDEETILARAQEWLNQKKAYAMLPPGKRFAESVKGRLLLSDYQSVFQQEQLQQEYNHALERKDK